MLSCFSTMPNTPSTDEMDSNDTLLNRRSSSGGLLSPEVGRCVLFPTTVPLIVDVFL